MSPIPSATQPVEITREGDSIWVNDQTSMSGRWTPRGCSIRDDNGNLEEHPGLTRAGFAVVMASTVGGQESDYR